MTTSGIHPHLAEQALLFATGGLEGSTRREFELLLRCDAELREYAESLSDAVTLLSAPSDAPVPAGLKERVLTLIDSMPQQAERSLVMSGPDGRVRWTNAAFSEMCGYSPEELAGQRLGPLLQGEKTDPDSALRLRRAIREGGHCREVILNYHKNRKPYWAEIDLLPIKDESGGVLCFVAEGVERKEIPIP
jgi:PAS domain S-box-containing protein